MRRSHFSPLDCCSCSSHYDHHHHNHHYSDYFRVRGAAESPRTSEAQRIRSIYLSIHPSAPGTHSPWLHQTSTNTKKELLLSHRWAIETHTHTRLTYWLISKRWNIITHQGIFSRMGVKTRMFLFFYPSPKTILCICISVLDPCVCVWTTCNNDKHTTTGKW